MRKYIDLKNNFFMLMRSKIKLFKEMFSLRKKLRNEIYHRIMTLCDDMDADANKVVSDLSSENIERNIEAIEEVRRLERLNWDMITYFYITWPVRALLLVLVLFLLILSTFERRKAEIELDVLLTDIQFTSLRNQNLTNAIPLNGRIVVKGLREAIWSRGEERLPLNGHRFFAVADTERSRYGRITLSGIDLLSSTQLSVQKNERSSALRILISGTHTEVNLSMQGAVYINDRPQDREIRIINRGTRGVRLIPRGDTIQFTLEMGPTQEIQFSPQLLIENLILYTIDEEEEGVRKISGIKDGRIFFEGLNRDPYKLRPFERIQFEHSEGIIRKLTISNGSIHLNFQGTVSGLCRQTHRSCVSMMPTWLEWFYANQWWVLFWGGASTVALFYFLLREHGLRV